MNQQKRNERAGTRRRGRETRDRDRWMRKTRICCESPDANQDDIDDNLTQIVHVENPATFAASCFFQSHGLRRDTGTVFVLVLLNGTVLVRLPYLDRRLMAVRGLCRGRNQSNRTVQVRLVAATYSKLVYLYKSRSAIIMKVNKAASTRRTKPAIWTEQLPVAVALIPNWMRSRRKRDLFITALILNIFLSNTARRCVAIWMFMVFAPVLFLTMVRSRVKSSR